MHGRAVLYLPNIYGTSVPGIVELGITKDHIEKIEFKELIFAVVNWPNSELYGAFVCITFYIG